MTKGDLVREVRDHLRGVIRCAMQRSEYGNAIAAAHELRDLIAANPLDVADPVQPVQPRDEPASSLYHSATR